MLGDATSVPHTLARVANAHGPSASLTFLFTDLANSTKLWEERPGDMTEALAEHDSILGDTIARNGGTIVKTGGDGLMAVFGDPDRAVTAAVEGQRGLRAARHADVLAARMGLCTGLAREANGDYFGPPVNRAARTMSTAHPGQILVAPSTAASVVSFQLLDLGEFRLKGLPPMRLSQVLADGLVAEFPRLSATPVARATPPTTFVGRVREIETARSLLAAHPLLTLTGVGGSGKTRLALQLAATVADEFADGAAFVDLAAVTDGADVAPALLRALGLGDDSSALDPLERAAVRVRSHSMLVIIDNCEHLLDACAEACEALVGTPDSRVLATSREPLGVAGEQVFVVPSLDPRSDAVDLFVDRARGARPDFALDDSSARVVAEICERLDGIPLAVELAAAQVARLAPAQLLERLDDRFRLLTGGRRRVQRQQTLAAALDWSHDLLDVEEQTFLRRLAAFPASFSLEAAETVSDASDAVVHVGSLVAKSLLDVASEGDRFRYRLLETVRLYAEQKLLAAGEADEVRGRHARWVVDSIESTPLERRWLDALDLGPISLADVRGALEWTTQSAHHDMAGLLASGINWTGADAWREGHRWCEEVSQASDLTVPVRVRILVSLCLGASMALSRQSSTFAKQAIEVAGDLIDPLVAVAWASRANAGAVTAIRQQDDHLAARIGDWAERGVTVGEEFEDPWRIYCRCMAGMTYTSLDKPALAQHHLEEGAKLLRDLDGYEGLRASTLGLLSVHLVVDGEPERALAVAEPIVATVHTPMPGREGALMAVVARAAAGDVPVARIEMNEYHDAARRTDLPLGVETVVIYGGVIAGLQDDWEMCARLLAAGAAGLARFPGTYLLYKEFRDRARAALGPDCARELRAQGQQLPLEEAVALAVGEIP